MPRKINKNLIIFEEFNQNFLSISCAHVKKGGIVAFFRLDKQARNNPKVQKYCREKLFIDLSKVAYDYMIFMRAITYAHKNLDSAFKKYFNNSPSIRYTKNLFNSDDIEDMYKKEVLQYLNELYYLELRINEYTADFTGSVEFYPSESIEFHENEDFSLLLKSVKIRKYSNMRMHIKTYQKKILEWGNFLYPPYIIFKKINRISRKPVLKRTYVIGINANLPALFSWNFHYIYYIVDKMYGIPKDQIIFIDETYRKDRPREFEENGFAYLNFLHERNAISLSLFKQFCRKFLPAYFKCLICALRDDPHTIKTTRLILTDYIRWHLLTDRMTIKNHITILLPDTITKNLILTENGVKTIYIYPDNYSADYHTGWDEKIPASIVYSFINTDIAVIYGDKIQRYFSVNRNTIKEYLPVGVLTAQRVKEIREGKTISKIRAGINEKNLQHPIIGVFDTTFAEYGPLKLKHGIQFGEDILRLLEDFPNIHIIFKEKKKISITPELAPVYKKLEKHPRCLVIRKTDTDCIFSSDVLAISDFVISAAYTTTTAEALASKTRAIYYDVAGSDIGDQYYFNRFPNLVAHNYEEMKKLVQYWLFQSTPDEFSLFLDTYVKNEIDPYLDMNAITRLHQILKSE